MNRSNRISKKMAVLSHILPPSPSGQAVVLSRLMSCIHPNEYVLISKEDYHGTIRSADTASKKLDGRYYKLRSDIDLHKRFGIRFSFLATPLSILINIARRTMQLIRIMKKERCDLLIACTGDLYDIPSGFLASKINKASFVPYMFDDYVNQWAGSYRKIARFLGPLIIRKAQGIIVPNDFLRKEYKTRYKVDSEIIHNPSSGIDIEKVDHAEKYFDVGFKNIVYAGAIYHANHDALLNLVHALQKLDRRQVLLHVFTSQNKKILKRTGIYTEKVRVHNHVNPGVVAHLLKQADILFLPLGFNTGIEEVIRTSAPGKMGDYLAAGKPILVHAPKHSYVSWYFTVNRCGLVVDHPDTGEVLQAIIELLQNESECEQYSKRALELASKDFDLETISKKFYNYLVMVRGKYAKN